MVDDDGIQGYLATLPGNRQRMARQYRQKIVPLTIPNGVYTQLRRVRACVRGCACVCVCARATFQGEFLECSLLMAIVQVLGS